MKPPLLITFDDIKSVRLFEVSNYLTIKDNWIK